MFKMIMLKMNQKNEKTKTGRFEEKWSLKLKIRWIEWTAD